MNKPPFIIKHEFMSPYLCEDIIDILDVLTPDIDDNGIPINSLKFNNDLEIVVFDILQNIIPEIQDHFSVEYDGTSNMTFQCLPQGSTGTKSKCDNSSFKNKWYKTSNVDFTGVIFLSDYNDNTPFSEEFEVFGGKLEFKHHGFGFNPKRGTLILFPSGPNFIYNFSKIILGASHFIKFNITCKDNFVYNRLHYPGNYLTWFNEIA